MARNERASEENTFYCNLMYTKFFRSDWPAVLRTTTDHSDKSFGTNCDHDMNVHDVVRCCTVDTIRRTGLSR